MPEKEGSCVWCKRGGMTNSGKRWKEPAVQALVFLGAASTLGLVDGGAWAAIGIAGALVLALSCGWRERSFPFPFAEAATVSGVMLAAAVFASAFAPQGGQSWGQTFKIASFLIPLTFLLSPVVWRGAAFPDRFTPVLAWFLVVGICLYFLVMVFVLIGYGRGDGVASKFNRGFSYGLMFFWPVAGALAAWRGKTRVRLGFLLGFAVTAGLCLTLSRAGQMAMLASALVWLCAARAPRATAACMVFGAGLALFWPLAVQNLFPLFVEERAGLPSSWAHRVEIWDYLSHRVQERPWTGWGVGQIARLDWAFPNGATYVYTKTPASHAHNAIMQLWTDCGVAGAVAYSVLVFAALRAALALGDGRAAFALAALAYAWVLLMTAYNLWTDSLWAAMTLTVLAFALVRGRAGRELREP